MTDKTNDFNPVLIKGGGLNYEVSTSAFLEDPELILLRDDYIAGVRRFSRQVNRERLDQAREQLGTNNNQKTPIVVKQIIDALQKRVLDGFTSNSSYMDMHLLNEKFAGLDLLDVEEFFKGFEEALVRFHSYCELASGAGRNVPLSYSVPRPKIMRFEDLASEIRNDIGSELFAEGLMVLSRMKDLGHAGNIEYDAADTPVLFFSRESLEQLFDTLDAVAQGEIPLSQDFPSVQELMERILEDPEVAPNEIMRVVRNEVGGDQNRSNHPSAGNPTVTERTPGPKNGSQTSIASRETQGRHLRIVR